MKMRLYVDLVYVAILSALILCMGGSIIGGGDIVLNILCSIAMISLLTEWWERLKYRSTADKMKELEEELQKTKLDNFN